MGMAPRAIITGAAGLIGQYLLKSASRWAPEWAVQGLTRAQLDLTDRSAVSSALQHYAPDVIIHCAALSRTKDCERDPETAKRINVDATLTLAALASNARLIFVSSGDVFDGLKGWYDESAQPNPVNVYGRTKFEAERGVLEYPAHSVVRIVLTAGTSMTGDRSFVEDMSRAARAGHDVALYADEFRCPLPAGVIARALWEFARQDKPGLYHLGGSERLSRWEIGDALLPWYPELHGRLVKSSSRTHAGAPRPADLSLVSDKIQRLLSFPIPGLRSWLSERRQPGDDLWDYEDGR
jgi:dTDP-4-dehydrorhamnose reductase